MIEAPWTAEQVTKLNEWQACGWVHEFTCPTAHPEGRALLATPSGWVCLRCGYRQYWAHEHMFNGAPPHPFADSQNDPKGSAPADDAMTRDDPPSSKTPHPSASSEQSSDGWRTIESAPLRTVVLAWSGGVRLMTLDDLGQWRNLLGRPKQPPVAWMPLPNPPGEPS